MSLGSSIGSESSETSRESQLSFVESIVTYRKHEGVHFLAYPFFGEAVVPEMQRQKNVEERRTL